MHSRQATCFKTQPTFKSRNPLKKPTKKLATRPTPLSPPSSLPLPHLSTTPTSHHVASLLTNQTRRFRAGNLDPPGPIFNPSKDSVSSRFRKSSISSPQSTLDPSSKPSPFAPSPSRSNRGSLKNSPPIAFSSNHSQSEGSSETEFSTEESEVFIPINDGENGVISPRQIAEAVTAALKQANGTNGLDFDLGSAKVKVMSVDQAKKLFGKSNGTDSDSDGSFIDAELIGEDSTDSSGNGKKKHLILDPANLLDAPKSTHSTHSSQNTHVPEVMSLFEQSMNRLSSLSAPEIVASLDAHVIAQAEAKKALAVAVRNRARRYRLGKLGKPENVSQIEEIGIQLALKHGYMIRSELYEQIGINNYTTTPESIQDQSSRETEGQVITANTTSQPVASGKSSKGKKGVKPAITDSPPLPETLQEAVSQANQKSTLPTLPPFSSPQSQTLDPLLNLPSKPKMTYEQSRKLFNNNKQYGKTMSKEVPPYNILMVGSSGSGKTELVKRLCHLLQSPWIHADSTRFTETGVVGADIDQILVDLYKDALNREKEMEKAKIRPEAVTKAISHIVNQIRGSDALFDYLESRGLGHLLTIPPPTALNNFSNSVTASVQDLLNSPSKAVQLENNPPTGPLSTSPQPSTTSTPSQPAKTSNTFRKLGKKGQSADQQIGAVVESPAPAKKGKKATVPADEVANSAPVAAKDTKKASQTTKPVKFAQVEGVVKAVGKKTTKGNTDAPAVEKKAASKGKKGLSDVVEETKPVKGKKGPKKGDGVGKTPVTVTAHTMNEGDNSDEKKGKSEAENKFSDALPTKYNPLDDQPDSKFHQSTKHDAMSENDLDNLATQANQRPHSKKLQVTPFDDHDEGLFSTDVDDESSYYHKHVKPMMFENLHKKYLGIPTVHAPVSDDDNRTGKKRYIPTHDDLRSWIEAGYLDDFVWHISLPVPPPPKGLNDGNNAHASISLEDLLQNDQKKKPKFKSRQVSVATAMEQLVEHHLNELVNEDELHERALKNAEQNGVVFLDEIDKLIPSERSHSGTSSHKGEGVQRELLSLLQGKVVKRGGLTINTENILFICAGAFHHAGPNQLLPELQGRLPVVTKLDPLNQVQLALVLTLPVYSVLKQYMTLMKADGVEIVMQDDAIWEMSQVAADLNERTMNLGARRLHNVINSVFGYISYNYANGLRLQVDELGRLKSISTDEENKQANKLEGVMNAKDDHNSITPRSPLAKQAMNNSLQLSVPIDPKNVAFLPNGETQITITKEYVKKTLKHMVDRIDISKYLL